MQQGVDVFGHANQYQRGGHTAIRACLDQVCEGVRLARCETVKLIDHEHQRQGNARQQASDFVRHELIHARQQPVEVGVTVALAGNKSGLPYRQAQLN